MFKLEPNPTFSVFVSGFVPGGTPRDGMLVEYRYKNAEEFTAWLESFKTRSLRDVLLDIIVTWHDAPLEFTRENLEAVGKSYPAIYTALVAAYRSELLEARTKN